MVDQLKIGVIGLDSSRCITFAELLNNPANPQHVTGGTITTAYAGGSPDFEFCYSRMNGFITQMRDQFGTELVETPEEVAERSDAIMILSGDGRVHLEQFRRIARCGKPVFIDKPLTVDVSEAEQLVQLAERHRVPVMSSSALRYTESLLASIASEEGGRIIGVDCYGPMVIEETQPGLFWYGIHAVEVMYAVMGRGCVSVSSETNKQHDIITALWSDGRMASIRGNRVGNHQFGAVIHREKTTAFIDISKSSRGYYAAQLQGIIHMFATGQSPEDISETVEIMRFIEAANRSREQGGRTVKLQETIRA